MLAKGCCDFSVTVTRMAMLLVVGPVLLLLLPPMTLVDEPTDAVALDLAGEEAPEFTLEIEVAIFDLEEEEAAADSVQTDSAATLLQAC